jgi:hypothetical protein
MGIEKLGEEKIEKVSLLERQEQAVMKKMKAIFKENAELNRLLLGEEDLDLSEHQKRYLTGQLSGIRRDTKDVLRELRA